MSRENLNQARQEPQQLPNNQQDQLMSTNGHLNNNDQVITSTSSSASSTNRISIQQNSTDEMAAKNTLDDEQIDENNEADIDDEDEDEDEDDVDCVEDSPDGRWSKRNQHVSQRDVPGIDKAYLAMDTENGFEVVWNEIYLTGGKRFKTEYLENSGQEKINGIFQKLINLNHPNIVKFHHYWIDQAKKRIVFITEYMPSGSLKQFLRKAKKTNQSIKKQTWKRWCIQLLSALHYLHNLESAIIHDDLSCDTIYIQHNGLIKIGCIAPDIVNTHVKTCVDFGKFARNAHYIAPEFRSNDTTDLPHNANPSSTTSSSGESGQNANQSNGVSSKYLNNKTTAVDIYAFGMVALEMFNLEFGGNGDTHPVTSDLIKQSIDALDRNQQDFILKCLETDPNKRPSAKDLLFHPLLFEVPSLRLLAAHQLIRNQNESKEANPERILNSFSKPADTIIATKQSSNPVDYKFAQLPQFDANKYFEDVKNGIYPLTAFGFQHQNSMIQTQQPQHNHHHHHHHNHHHHHHQHNEKSIPNEHLPNNLTNNNNNNSNGTLNRQSSSNINSSSQKADVLISNDSTNSSGLEHINSSNLVNGMILDDQQQDQQTCKSLELDTSLSNPIDSNHVSNHFISQMQQQFQNNLGFSSSSASSTPTPTQQMQQHNQLIQQQGGFYSQIPIDSANKLIMTSSSSSLSSSPPPLYSNGNHTSQQQSLTANLLSNISENYFAQFNNGSRTQSPTNNSNMGLMNFTDQFITNNVNDSLNIEKRHLQKCDINIKLLDKQLNNYDLCLRITFDDKAVRLIQSQIFRSDPVNKLADELVSYGLLNELDKKSICARINEAWNKFDTELNL